METTTTTTIHSKQPQEGDNQNQGPSSSGHESPPLSPSSSPSHDFSFTFSLQPTSQTTPPTPTSLRGIFNTPNKAHHPPSIAIDLSPADEIFFHGHLLPLRLLSHASTSPRTSTTSLDNLNLPIRELVDDAHKKPTSDNNAGGAKTGTKNSNYFSLFGLAKWRKVFDVGNRQEIKKKVSFDVGRVLRRYARAVRPILLFRRGEKKKHETTQQPYLFSGNLNWRRREWGGRRGGEFSAPASMRTSPTNSGLLLATAAATMAAPSNDSTMEELQSAIQAAIAHCKNSIAGEDQENRKC